MHSSGGFHALRGEAVPFIAFRGGVEIPDKGWDVPIANGKAAGRSRSSINGREFGLPEETVDLVL